MRPPFRFVSELVDREPGKWARGRVCFWQAISDLEKEALVPPELLIEAAAQVGLLINLAEAAPDPEARHMLAAVDRFEWSRPVRAAEVCEIETRATLQRGGWETQEATITVGGEAVASGRLIGFSQSGNKR
ncbi:MAG: fabZ [Symbiobacteriaceae bacterium]|jgi:3-hydroxyacyl-[acyl-carrier-protein] dehydratase|nr:fabZ [Symbiobacteriaceae bacterium]